MKKFATMISFVALFVLLAAGASALQLNGATIGGENADRINNASQSFYVTNNDTSSVSLTFASTADSKYNVRFVPATATLAANETKSITVYADIPRDLDGVEESESASDYLEPKVHTIGEIQAKSGSNVLASSALKMQAANQLEIKKVYIDCDGNSESVDDGDKIEDLKPDMQCSFEVQIKNNFDEDDDEYPDGSDKRIGDVDLEDVEVSIESDDLDISESPDINSISSKETEPATTDIEIGDDADDGTYSVKIQVHALDENNALHGEEWTIRLEVNRLTHDIQIRSPSISPSTVSACDGGAVRILTKIANYGTRDEDEVAVELEVPDLKFTKRLTGIELDADDTVSQNFVFDVPAKAKPGIYRATLTTFFDDTAQSNTQALEFTVEKCDEPEVVVVPPAQQNATVTPQTGGQTAQPTGGAVAVPRARVTSTSGFTNSAAYLWVLAGVGAVLLLIIIILLVVAFRKPRQDVL